MKTRVERIQTLFKAHFGVDISERDIQGYLNPRLIKYMDAFLDAEISDRELIDLHRYFMTPLDKEIADLDKKLASSNEIRDLQDSHTKPVPKKGKRRSP